MKKISLNQVQELMNLKLEAIKGKDLSAYLKTISFSKDNYIIEETGWFKDMLDESFKDLSLDVISIKQVDEEKVEAIIQLKHQRNDGIDIKYPLLVGYENGILKDFDLNFLTVEDKRFTLKFLEDDTRADDFYKIIEKAFYNIENIFHKKMNKKVIIKMYKSKELLRQRTVASINWQYYGWAEDGESLKFFSGLENIKNYQGLIQHELVHIVTLNISKGNEPAWLVEGIAMYYGDAYYPYKDDIVLKDINKYDLNKSLEYLKAFDYYKETDLNLIFEWYCVCGLYLKYMVEIYSHEKVLDLFFEIGNFNKMDNSKKLDVPEFHKMLPGIVLGDNEKEISKGYLKWIKKQKFTLK